MKKNPTSTRSQPRSGENRAEIPASSAAGATHGGTSFGSKRLKRRRKGLRFAGFFTKQVIACIILAFIIIVIDTIIYINAAIRENDQMFNESAPSIVTKTVDRELTSAHGAFTLTHDGQAALDSNHAWALVLDDEGTVVWESNVPASIPRSFDVSSIAMAAHYAYLNDYPVFFWKRDDGLLITGFPPDSYWSMMFTFPENTIHNAFYYLLFILGIDLLVLLVFFLLSRRHTIRAVEPIGDALEDLAEGRPVELKLKGDLREVGDYISDASRIIQEKDRAREMWIRGISHDARTPLAIIVGYAERVSTDEDTPTGSRADAAHIKEQALKISGLVEDLNTATRLEFSVDPLTIAPMNLARFIRSMVANVLNNTPSERYPVDVNVDPDAQSLMIRADERLLTRALENILTNARVHNPQGCTITLSLSRFGEDARIEIADDGIGMGSSELAAIRARLALARAERVALGKGDHGLGLVLVDRIIALHGGTMSIDATAANDETPEASTTSPGASPATADHSHGFRIIITIPLMTDTTMEE